MRSDFVVGWCSNVLFMAAKKRRMVDVVAAGKLGGDARAANLSAEELAEGGRLAASERWKRYYAAHPEKWRERQAREAKKGTVPRGRPPKKKSGKKK
jgi:hypothetical protein